jgi:acyl carrier protein
MMQDEVIKNRIDQLLIDEIELDKDQMYPEADLKNDLGIDSLDFVDLFVIVENNFGFKMKAEEMSEIRTLQDFYDYIIKRVNPS